MSDKVDVISKDFPADERFGLTSQIRRCASSVCVNLGESYGKRHYPAHFIAKITDALSENYETQVWLDKALTRGYINRPQYDDLNDLSDEVARILHWMEHHPEHFKK